MVTKPTSPQLRRSSLALLFLFGIGPWFSVGANANEFAYLELSLEQLLETPVTGSTLTEESLKTVPAAASIFTREHIERLGVDYLHELLSLVPGFQFNRNANSGLAYTYSARGRRSTQVSLEVLLLVDGKVFNDPRAGSPDVTLPLYPLLQVERVEVIRGPGSALYGSSAFTGVINIITRKQQKALVVSGGSQQRRSVDLLWGGQSDDWQADVYVHAYEDQGDNLTIRDSFTGLPLASQDPRQLLNIDMGLKRGLTQLDVTYYKGQADDFYLSENTANDFNHHQRSFTHVSLDQGIEWSPKVKSTFALSYQRFSFSLEAIAQGPGALSGVSSPSSNDPLMVDATQAGETTRLAFTTDWAIDNYSSAQWGLQAAKNTETWARAYTNYDLEALINLDFPIRYFGDMDHSQPIGLLESQTNTGLYAQYIRNLRDSTRITLGGRYDNYPDIEGRFSPRLALVEQLNQTYSLKLLYGEAFRAPTLAETAFINNPTLIGNPDLKHEVVKTWDLILLGNWDTTSVSLGVFQNRYDHPIMTGFIDNIRTYVNGDGEQSEGLEVEWLQTLGERWSLRSTYTHMNLPDTALREAESLASVEINYAAARWNWNLSGFYQDQRQALITANSSTGLDDFWVLNTQWRYRFNNSYDISLQIKNLTDADYATPAQGLGKPEGVPNRGRELTAAIQWHF